MLASRSAAKDANPRLQVHPVNMHVYRHASIEHAMFADGASFFQLLRP